MPRRVPGTILSRVSIRVMVAFAVVQGAAILVADAARFTSPGYSVVRQAPGGMDMWGVVLVVAGVVTLVGSLTGHFRVKGLGLFLIAFWCFVFGVGVFAALLTTPNVGATGPAVYYVVGY